MSDTNADEIIEEFLVESTENLDELDRTLVALEAAPTSEDLLASVFRTFHTIKGTSGFLGFRQLEELSHHAENLLAKLREGHLLLDQRRTSVLLEVVDAVRQLLSEIETRGEEGRQSFDELVNKLLEVQSGGDEHIRSGTDGEGPLESPGSANVIDAEGSVVEKIDGDIDRDETQPPATAEESNADHRSSVAERTVRVDVDLLDALMRQVGELVLARNQIMAHADSSDDTNLLQTVQRLSLIVSELQEGVMKTRMQPVEQLWAKLPRVVRDLAAQFGKKVHLDMEGGETELDRSVLEAVKDPLTHLVRNAVDHGIETPAERTAAGKSDAGTLSLRAFHEGGQVVMEVADNGKGLDIARIGNKAVERGLVSTDTLARMSEREVLELIFKPGFSTADKVTNVSGRGVGMDVVRTNIERIGGTVDLSGSAGHGTSFRIKIPLTLAIIPALLVRCHDERYAIPQAGLVELVHLERDQVKSAIEYIGDAPVYRLRGRLLPLVSLDKSLGVGPTVPLHERDSVSIIVLQAETLQFGAVVDGVVDTQEIVVKPLGRHFKHLPAYAGATILGDGSVALILDVNGLASHAGMTEGALSESSVDGSEEGSVSEGSGLVLLRVGAERRIAVPLDVVARLEVVGADNIEFAGQRPVLQYRDQLLPLVYLTDLLGESVQRGGDEPDNGNIADELPVVVFSGSRGQVGFIASEILDIVDGSSELEQVGAGGSVLGSCVVHGRVTDMLDVDRAVDSILGAA